uniref:Transposable element P transposase-like GTP-binding insertion domain-containing protein n=1 Tax=Amphimedon queenslandica TaxID=400682 RepID=A0A1X7VIT5_AMPQE
MSDHTKANSARIEEKETTFNEDAKSISIEKKLSDLIQERGVRVDELLGSDLLGFMKDIDASPNNNELWKGLLRKILWTQQLKNASLKDKRLCNGSPLSWQPIIDLYEKNKGQMSPTGGGLFNLKLKYEHVHLNSYSKMRVDLASQVLSETVSCALKEDGHAELAKFVEYFDHFFDCLNVSSISAGKHKLKSIAILIALQMIIG